MTEDVHELPAGTWCLRLTLEPQAQDAAAIQWAIFSQDPLAQFIGNLQRLTEHLGAEVTDPKRREGWPAACWNGVFRSVRGDRVYILTPAPEQAAVTTNEVGGRKWAATKTVRSGPHLCSWCVPFDVAVGQIVDLSFNSENRMKLENLVVSAGGA